MLKYRLQDLQDHFITNLKAKNPIASFLDHFQSNAFSSMDRFEIYRQSWRAGALKALAKVYPVCQQLVGKNYFQKMTEDYIDRYPSLSPTLYDYGAYLAEYLVNTLYSRELPYLMDVARLEWAIYTVLLGPENTLFDSEALSRVSEEQHSQICFYRRQNSVLYYGRFPVDRIWETNQVDFVGNDRVDLEEGEVYLFIYRSGYDLRIDRLNAFQWSLLDLLTGDLCLGQLPVRLGEERAEQALMELPILIQKGYITNFIL